MITLGTYGLIGKVLTHSFSPSYFAKKFEQEKIKDVIYKLFPLAKIEDIVDLLRQEPNLKGLNVTIPYKQAVIPFLDELSAQASAIGAVNTIQFLNGKLIGHNTDVYGFQQSLEGCLTNETRNSSALILGTGGASLAVAHGLKALGIDYQLVSRTKGEGHWTYEDLSGKRLSHFKIIINTTPLGMAPHINTCPELAYEFITTEHLLFDLVYNPEETLFMREGRKRGAKVVNGLEMLHLQAEKAWEIWTGF